MIITLPVQPMAGAEPLMCWANVQKRIRALGGRAVYGWEVRPDPLLPVEVRASHVVWESPGGDLMCVTPRFEAVDGGYTVVGWPDSIRFVRDDAATFEGRSRGTRYVAGDTSLAAACEYMTRADAALFAGADIEKCKYWTGRANAELRRAGYRGHGWSAPDSLHVGDVLTTMLA